MSKQRKIPFFTATLTLLVFLGIAAYMIIVLHAEPHIPMIAGVAIVGAVAMGYGASWKDIEDGMVEGMTKALSACTILFLIGLLIGSWINAGVVPSLIYYGVKALSPKNFLVGCLLLCSAISMTLGSWGTAGTIGIALISISHILGIPPALTAGAIISGAYFGDRVSPITDMSNLLSAVTEQDIMQVIKKSLPLNLIGLGIASVVFYYLGKPYWNGVMGTEVDHLVGLLQDQFYLGLICLVPLVLLLVCILVKIPAIPSIFVGIVSSGVFAVVVQHRSLESVLSCCFFGYSSNTGNQVIDSLLSTGGIESMQYSVSLALVAMMLGGVMEKTGIVDSFMNPLIGKLKRKGDLSAAVVASTLAVNVVLPDAYVALALPGRMFGGVYKQHQVSQLELSRALGSGAISLSPIIPWNACGVFMATVLGVSVAEYAPFCILNYIVAVGAIVFGYLDKPLGYKRKVTT